MIKYKMIFKADFLDKTNETRIIFQKTPMNFNSGAKKGYYFVPVNDSSSKFLEK